MTIEELLAEYNRRLADYGVKVAIADQANAHAQAAYDELEYRCAAEGVDLSLSMDNGTIVMTISDPSFDDELAPLRH